MTAEKRVGSLVCSAREFPIYAKVDKPRNLELMGRRSNERLQSFGMLNANYFRRASYFTVSAERSGREIAFRVKYKIGSRVQQQVLDSKLSLTCPQ